MITKAVPTCEWLTQALHTLGRGDRIYATGIPWSVYARLADLRDMERPRVKITFDRGSIELMSPRYRHEKPSHRLSLLVLVLAEELNRELVGAGSTTFQLEQSEKGLEPDECFYIANAPAILAVEDIDLTIHPPPDLAIEVDLTSSSLPKESIYSSLGVPELWRHEDEQVVVRVLEGDGTYKNADRSRSFPEIRAVDLTRLLAEADQGGDIALVRGFRREIRKILASPTKD